MAERSLILNKISSPDDVIQVLKTLIRPIKEEDLNKNAFKGLLSGLSIIVKSWEKNDYEISHEDALQWFRFFLGTRNLISSSSSKMKLYLSSVPIAITYIIGSLHQAANNLDFYSEALKIAFELVKLMDQEHLKKFENFGKGVISLLWNVIDRVGDFQTQMQVLELYVLILKDLDKNFVFEEVKRIQNCKSDEITYKILDLLRMRKDDNLFKKSARSILNQHNLIRYSDAQVQSFYCKTLEIGESMKFIKPTYINRFWFDINKFPRTLTFEGRIAPKNSRKYQDLTVSIKIVEMFQSNNYLNIKFTPPAIFTGIQLENNEFNQVNVARISLCKTEQTRFLNFFNVPVITENPFVEVQSKRLPSSPNELFNITTNISKSWKQTNLNKSNGNLTGKCLGKARRKQIQQVNPLPKKVTQPLDEYDYMDVSDAEPCQSYRNFIKRHSVTNSLKKPLKRPLAKENSDQNQSQYNINVWDFGPSTSKKLRQCVEAKQGYRNEGSFDKLKTKNSLNLYKSQTIDLTNDSSKAFNEFTHSREDFEIENEVNMNQKNIQIMRTPDSRDHFELRSSITKRQQSGTKILSSSYELQKSPLICDKDKNDCLIYHKRSDSESGSESSNMESISTRKRKLTNIHKSNAKKRLFDTFLDQENVDSDSDFDFTEIVLVAQKDFRTKIHKMSSKLSSFFYQMFGQQMFAGNKRRNVLSFEDLESLFKCIQP